MAQVKLCWFNQRWNVYIQTVDGGYGWNYWTKVSEITKRLNNGTYRLTTYTSGGLTFYSYGFLTDSLDERPGHKGEWSSNCSNINGVFGMNITEVGIDSMATAIDVGKLEELLGDKYKFVDTKWGRDILSVDGIIPKDHTWVTI